MSEAPELEVSKLTEAQYQIVAERMWASLCAELKAEGGNCLDAPGIVAMLLANCATRFSPNEGLVMGVIASVAFATLGEAEAKLARFAATPTAGRA